MWQAVRRGLPLAGAGNAALLQTPLVAFFASRQCSGVAIRAATDWALQQVRSRCALVSGFHSPLEQTVLRLALEAGNPVVVALARPVAGAELPQRWCKALAAGTMAVVSVSATNQRLTEKAARDRNDLAVRLADRVVIGHASASGQLSKQCADWLADGFTVEWLSPSP